MLLAKNFFEFHARVQKCHFGKNEKFIQDLCRKKYKKGIFSDVQWWKQISAHFSDSTHQECIIFARIGHGPCYYHWNEIFAGVHYNPLTHFWGPFLCFRWGVFRKFCPYVSTVTIQERFVIRSGLCWHAYVILDKNDPKSFGQNLEISAIVNLF